MEEKKDQSRSVLILEDKLCSLCSLGSSILCSVVPLSNLYIYSGQGQGQPCKGELFSLCYLFQGLAKRVGARLLLASTSEVYGGKTGTSHSSLITYQSSFRCFLNNQNCWTEHLMRVQCYYLGTKHICRNCPAALFKRQSRVRGQLSCAKTFTNMTTVFMISGGQLPATSVTLYDCLCLIIASHTWTAAQL